MQNIWQIWQNFDPRLIVAGVVGSMFTLAFVIHILLYVSPSFNWLGDSGALPEAAAELVPLPQFD